MVCRLAITAAAISFAGLAAKHVRLVVRGLTALKLAWKSSHNIGLKLLCWTPSRIPRIAKKQNYEYGCKHYYEYDLHTQVQSSMWQSFLGMWAVMFLSPLFLFLGSLFWLFLFDLNVIFWSKLTSSAVSLFLAAFKEVAVGHWRFDDSFMLFFARTSSCLAHWKVLNAMVISLTWSLPVLLHLHLPKHP